MSVSEVDPSFLTTEILKTQQYLCIKDEVIELW